MSRVPGYKEWAATKDAAPASVGVDMDKWEAEFYDDDGSALFKMELQDMAKDASWNGSVDRVVGTDVGGTHDDGSWERLPLTKSISLWQADMDDENEKDQAQKEVEQLLAKWSKKKGWKLEVEFL